jgi:hypothetical protein
VAVVVAALGLMVVRAALVEVIRVYLHHSRRNPVIRAHLLLEDLGVQV